MSEISGRTGNPRLITSDGVIPRPFILLEGAIDGKHARRRFVYRGASQFTTMDHRAVRGLAEKMRRLAKRGGPCSPRTQLV